MPDLLAGTTILAQDWPEAQQNNDSTDISDIDSVPYVPGTPEVGTTFVAPTSGRVLVFVFASMRSDGDNQILVSWEMYEGGDSAGTLVQSAVDDHALSDPTGGIVRKSAHNLQSGLTPGATHFVRTMHRVSGGTLADLFNRRITVVPAS